MSYPTDPSHDFHLIRLGGDLNIYRAAEIRAELMEAFERTAHIEIDLSDVSELDSAGVQLLLLAKRAADADGRVLRLSGHSEAVREVFARLNLSAHFDDHPALTGKKA